MPRPFDRPSGTTTTSRPPTKPTGGGGDRTGYTPPTTPGNTVADRINQANQSSEQQAAAQRQQLDDAVARLNALYGIAPTNPGTGFDPNVATAAASKQHLDQLINEQTAGAVDIGRADLNTGMDNWLTGTRRKLGDQGLLGGSVDQDAQASAIRQYLQGRTNLDQAKKDAATNIQNSFSDRRANLEDQIRSGGSANTDAIADLSSQSSDISSALSDLPGRAVGDLFAGGVGSYAQGTLQADQSAQHKTLLNALNGGTSGRYSEF